MTKLVYKSHEYMTKSACKSQEFKRKNPSTKKAKTEMKNIIRF